MTEFDREATKMCQVATPGATRSVNAPPRWGLLYAGTLSQLAALGAVEVVHSPQVLRVTLRGLLALGIFATMSVWLRTNRPALDLQDWCECAGERMTTRVVESARPLALPAERLLVPAALDEDHELVSR